MSGDTIDARRPTGIIARADGAELLTREQLRRELRRHVVRRRRDDEPHDVPTLLVMHPQTWEDIALEQGPGPVELEVAWRPDGSTTFCGIPILQSASVPEHTVEVRW